MIKKGILVVVLGVFLIGCKGKRKVAHAKHHKKESRVTPPKSKKKTYYGGHEDLPMDTGEFVRFPINSIEEYIDTFSEIAQREMKAYGIPASITLAQGLLESGYGRGELALKTNNHFGIKCHKGWQGDRDYHDDDEKGECFRKYNHPMYSFRDHSIFLSGRSRYASLFELDGNDYRRWAKGLKKAGYATDKRYPQKLIALIERHRLYKFDDRAGRGRGRDVSLETSPTTSIYVVKAGDTLYSISRRYLVSVDELMRLNRMDNSTISIGQELTVRSNKINK